MSQARTANPYIAHGPLLERNRMVVVGREPTLVAAVVAASLAVALLAARPNSRVHRALALLLFLRAIGGSLLSYSDGITAPVDRLWVYFILAWPFAALNLGYVLWQENVPPRFAHTRRQRAAFRALILMLALLVQVAYLIDHSLFVGVDADGFAVSGPLEAVADAWTPTFALVAVLLAALARQALSLPRRRGMALAAFGLTLEPVFVATHDIIGRMAGAIAYGWSLGRLGTLGLSLLTLVLGATAIVVLQRGARARGELGRGLSLGSLILLGMVGASAILVHILNAAGVRLLFGVQAFWFLAFAALAAYTVVRYEFFGIEVRARFALKQSTVVAIIGATFIVTSELLEMVIRLPNEAISMGVAVALAFAFHRVQRFAESLTERLMPEVQKTAEYSAARRRDIYRTAVEDLARDGRLDTLDIALLARLRRKLELGEEFATRIEAEVQAEVLRPPAMLEPLASGRRA